MAAGYPPTTTLRNAADSRKHSPNVDWTTDGSAITLSARIDTIFLAYANSIIRRSTVL